MFGQYNNIKIVGCASAVPEYCMDNNNFSSVFGDRRTKKQIKLTGIERHHMSVEWQKASDLGMAAAKRLLSHLDWDPYDIRILIYVTQSPDYRIPSTAMDLADRLGIGHNCLAYDINLGCSGFDLGIQTVASLLQSQPDDSKGLLIVGEKTEFPDLVTVHPDKVANIMMFGSGGACIALTKQQDSRFVFDSFSYGDRFDYILSFLNTPTRMNGVGVYEFADEEVSEHIKGFLSERDILPENITGYLFHQAQKTLVDTVEVNCKLPHDKVLISYDKYGNTSSASIPITLCHNFGSNKESANLRFVSCGFGVGLSIGITCWEIDQSNILPVIETDEYFSDHIKRKGFLYDRKALIFNLGDGDPVLDMISRQLDTEGCKVDSIGDTEHLSKLYDGLFFKDNESYSSVKEIPNIFQQYDAFVFEAKNIDIQDIQEALKFAISNNLVAENCKSIILFDRQKFSRQKAEKAVLNILEVLGMNSCGIMYDSDNIDTYPLIYKQMDWFERRLFEKETNSMATAIKLGFPVIDLLRRYNDEIKTAFISI